MNFFYYTINKLPADMTDDELVDELYSCVFHADSARVNGNGINAKETVRMLNCENELMTRPGGINKWKEIFCEQV